MNNMIFLKDTTASDNVNFIRGLAAFSVLFAHLRNGLFVPYSEIFAPSLLVKIIYFFSGLGAEAVMIFFVLSGFLIGAPVYHGIKNNSFSWYSYLVARLVRLYIVLFPALILSAVVTYVGYVVILRSSFYPNIDFYCLSLNLLFLQTIFTDAYAGNIPLWSLCNEFWYYLLFPLMVFIYYRGIKAQKLFLMVVFSVCIMIGLRNSFYYLIWLMGFLVCLMKPLDALLHKGKVRKVVLFFVFLGLMFNFILVRTHVFSNVMLHFSVAIVFSLFLYFMLHDYSLSKKGRYSVVATHISSFSYTLYLIHYPILMVIEKSIHVSWPADIQHTLYGLIIFSSICLFAYFFSLLTEANSNKVRVFMMSVPPVFFRKLAMFYSKEKKLSHH